MEFRRRETSILIYFALLPHSIAKKRRVFKVETVGDYSVVMARFAVECKETMDNLTKRLEVSLGPDTGDLKIRIGLHSGPVTAGVLRGERARFQLFGDTMNTAARLESTGQPGRIHASEETSDLLVAAGKQHWLIERLDTVYAKGKGALKVSLGNREYVNVALFSPLCACDLQTFWMVDEHDTSETKSANLGSPRRAEIKYETNVPMLVRVEPIPDSKMERLIDWNIDVLLRLLKQVVARRESCGLAKATVPAFVEESPDNNVGSVLDEVKEIISLPRFDPEVVKNERPAESIELSPTVQQELKNYVSSLASMYQDNPFHNFEHASHVTMSVVKLLSRIVAPTDEVFQVQSKDSVASSMHDHTYGITSDPLTQFACVLSALIHDADHPGVPNAQLVKEGNNLATFYQNQSVAEQIPLT